MWKLVIFMKNGVWYCEKRDLFTDDVVYATMGDNKADVIARCL